MILKSTVDSSFQHKFAQHTLDNALVVRLLAVPESIVPALDTRVQAAMASQEPALAGAR